MNIIPITHKLKLVKICQVQQDPQMRHKNIFVIYRAISCYKEKVYSIDPSPIVVVVVIVN